MTTPRKTAKAPKKTAAAPPADLTPVPVAEPPITEPRAELLPDGSVRVPLGDGYIVVPDHDNWPSSANEDVTRGFYRTWASKVLSDDDYAYWVALDPTNRQVNEFFGALHDARSGSATREVLRLSSRLGIA